jgi:hypothetical protein
MATFAAWVKAQDQRDDAVGNFARYWEQVSPGRISTPTGIERHLAALGESLAVSGDERGRIALGAAVSGYHLAVKEYHQSEALDNAVRTGAIPPPAPGSTFRTPAPEGHVSDSNGSRPDDSPAQRLKGHAERPLAVPPPPVMPAPPVGEQLNRIEAGLNALAASYGRIEERLNVLQELLVGRMTPLTDHVNALATYQAQLQVMTERVYAELFPEPVDWQELWTEWAEFQAGDVR